VLHPQLDIQALLKPMKVSSIFFLWKCIKEEINAFVVECDTYQCNKGEKVKAPSTLQLFPILPNIWKDILMDFIIGLPKSRNKSFTMVVVDHFFKSAHFFALQHLFTAPTMDQLFMDNIFKLHGIHHYIVSDCDPNFTNNVWKEYFKLQGTQLHLSSAYHT
jgi:hypothetical protein